MACSQLACPACGRAHLSVLDYDSLIVLAEGLALFAFTCPACGQRVSSVRPIPDELGDEVEFAAIEVGAGMGRVG